MEAHSPEVKPQGTGSAMLSHYLHVRNTTENICRELLPEDTVLQPADYVSPPKWHLAHTTWFFETFILKPDFGGYKLFHPDFHFLFNSYYESLGKHLMRPRRGNLSRPVLQEIYQYRKHVDAAMCEFIMQAHEHAMRLIELGLQHEQQHQELLHTDIKFILGHNPLFPRFESSPALVTERQEEGRIKIEAGLYHIGHSGPGFCFDNELNLHDVYLDAFSISKKPVTNGEYLEFIKEDGYKRPEFWHSEAWDLIRQGQFEKPLYWHQRKSDWFEYTGKGLQPLNSESLLCHVNFYEASAYANWKGKRLPTEFEWEAAADQFSWGQRWEWTNSAYLPYPGFKKDKGALGEYNGKFMVNQMVLRGASCATPKGHSRKSYRNFFHPHLQWQFSGIRLCESSAK